MRNPIRDESGALTQFALFLFLAVAILGGLAVDVSSLIASATQLQVAADSTAHAALYTRDSRTESDAKTLALQVAATEMPEEEYGDVLTTDDIVFGVWNSNSRSFTPQAGSSSAVMVDTSRLSSKANGVGTFLLDLVGFDVWDVRRVSVFETYKPTCLREGYVAQDIVDVQSGNSYTNGFCVHSNTHVEVNNNNFYADGTIVSMPNKNDLVLPSSGFDSNEGLQEALRDGAYEIRILNQMQDIIDDLESGGATYTPDYITSANPIVLGSRQVDETDFTPGRIHTMSCNGNQQLYIKDGATLQDVVLVTDCKVKFGQGTTLIDTVIATTNTDAKSFNAPSTLQIGRDDTCATGGGAQLLTMGGAEFAADMRLFGGQVVAQDNVEFSANAHGIEGASIISGGRIDGTSNTTMGFCGSGMEDNFEAWYFRLAA